MPCVALVRPTGGHVRLALSGPTRTINQPFPKSCARRTRFGIRAIAHSPSQSAPSRWSASFSNRDTVLGCKYWTGGTFPNHAHHANMRGRLREGRFRFGHIDRTSCRTGRGRVPLSVLAHRICFRAHTPRSMAFRYRRKALCSCYRGILGIARRCSAWKNP